jgi:hypothetical protein
MKHDKHRIRVDPDAHIRLSLQKLLSLLEKHDIVPTTIYTVDGFIRVMEANGKRPFVISVPERYILSVPPSESVAIKEVSRTDIDETTDNPITVNTDLFGLASLTYPLLTIEIDGVQITYTVNADDTDVGKAETKVVRSTKHKGNTRIRELEKDARKLVDTVEEVSPESIEKANVVTPKEKSQEGGIELIFVDVDGEDIEKKDISDLMTGLPEIIPDGVLPSPDEDALAMIYPAITLEKFFKTMKEAPKRFSKELAEAYNRRDGEFERAREKRYDTVLTRFEEWKKSYDKLNKRIGELAQEEKRLSDILETIETNDGKSKKDEDKHKLETSRIRLQTIALRREAEVERMRLEARLTEVLGVMSSSFDYLNGLFGE